MSRKIWVAVDGKKTLMTVEDAINEGMLRKALKGDHSAFLAVVRAKIAYAKAHAQIPPTREQILQEMAEEKEREEYAARITKFIGNVLDREAASNKPERGPPTQQRGGATE